MAIFTKNFYISDITKYHHYFMNAGHVFQGHAHSTYELNFIIDGKIQISCGDDTFELGKGEAILLPPYKFHSCCYIDKTELIVVNIETPDIKSYEKALIYTLDEKSIEIFKYFYNDIEENALLDNSELNICLESPESARKLLEVFFQFSDAYKKEYIPKYNESINIFNHAAQYMFENLTEKLTISDIATECKVCQTTLKKVFTDYTGDGCIAFFNKLRMEQAKRMLISGASCREIIETLGFSSQASFSKRFKELYGVVPSKIKRK